MDKCIINIRAHIFESYILNRISCGEMGWEHVFYTYSKIITLSMSFGIFFKRQLSDQVTLECLIDLFTSFQWEFSFHMWLVYSL